MIVASLSTVTSPSVLSASVKKGAEDRRGGKGLSGAFLFPLILVQKIHGGDKHTVKRTGESMNIISSLGNSQHHHLFSMIHYDKQTVTLFRFQPTPL
jgi:hypothetical protein